MNDRKTRSFRVVCGEDRPPAELLAADEHNAERAAFRASRRQANDSLALQDMLARGTSAHVPRGMHPEGEAAGLDATPAPDHSGTRWLLGIMTGLAIAEGLLLAWVLR